MLKRSTSRPSRLRSSGIGSMPNGPIAGGRLAPLTAPSAPPPPRPAPGQASIFRACVGRRTGAHTMDAHGCPVVRGHPWGIHGK